MLGLVSNIFKVELRKESILFVFLLSLNCISHPVL